MIILELSVIIKGAQVRQHACMRALTDFELKHPAAVDGAIDGMMRDLFARLEASEGDYYPATLDRVLTRAKYTEAIGSEPSRESRIGYPASLVDSEPFPVLTRITLMRASLCAVLKGASPPQMKAPA